MARKSGSIPLPDAYRGREQAYVKHCLLEAYLEKLFFIVGVNAERLGIKEFCYVDCFAGPWGDESESLESTSIAISLRNLNAEGRRRSKFLHPENKGELLQLIKGGK